MPCFMEKLEKEKHYMTPWAILCFPFCSAFVHRIRILKTRIA